MEPPAQEPVAPAAPAPVAAPVVEPVQPAYGAAEPAQPGYGGGDLFGAPSLLSQQQAAAPSTFYTSQPAQPYPMYTYAQPAATSYTMPMTQYTPQYTGQP